MKNEIIVIAIVLIVVGFYLLGPDLMSFLNDGTPDPGEFGVDSEELEYSNFDIYNFICHITGKSLDRETTYEHIEALNIKLYGSETDYSEIYGEYSIYFNGWTLLVRNFISYPAGGGVVIAYSKGAQASMVYTATTDAIETYTGHRTLTMTADGTIADFYAFYRFIEWS
jgi:hypothetical protein